MQNANRPTRTKQVLVMALILILVGDLLAAFTQTNWGNVLVRDVRFAGTNGMIMSGLLYVPKGVTNKNPAPGILAIHGYINSRETQDGFAIEFARRGYVVLAPDQTGHGYSDPPAFANGFGGPDGLRYLRSLDIVDPKNIGLEGHSMGGWANAIAAGVFKDAYQSIILAGSSTGTYGAPEGTATFPRNLGLIYSEWDEFSQLMWLTPIPKNIVKGDKLKAVFGTKDDVVVGKLYGSIEQGTARKLYMPRTTHPGDHISTVAIGDAVEWFQATLRGGNGLPPSNQIWYWKEIGNLLALIGMVLLLFPVGSLLLKKASFFNELQEAPAEIKSATGIGWWISAAILVILPALTLFPFKEIFTQLNLQPSSVFPENITSQVLIWAVLNGVIALVLFLLWHFVFNRKTGATASSYGLTWGKALDWKKIGKSFLLAALVAFAGYMTLAFSDWLFKVDYRFWVFAVKPMSPLHFQIFLCYLIPFTLYFLVLGTVLHGQLRPTGGKGTEISRGREMLINVVLLVLGFVVLLLIQYIPLLSGGTLANPVESLWSIIAFQFLPLMTIAALVNTYFYRKTGHVYVGSFLSAMLIVWIVVASQAIHFAF
jgi:pimeloyl-ACP methyl ester carboxylesterase